MRIIDADELEPTAVLGVQLQHADSRYYYFYEEETIKNAPTVEAIPIEWIAKYEYHMSNIYGPMDISTMVRKYKEGFIPSVPEKGPVK